MCQTLSIYVSSYRKPITNFHKKPEINSGNKKGEGGIRTPGPD